MEIREMNIEQVESRMAEIRSMDMENMETAELETINAESEELEQRKLQLIEERKAEIEREERAVQETEVVEELEEEKPMAETRITREMPEYRDAFFATLKGNATVEQRSIFADNTDSGDGAALPVGLDTMIWDQLTTAHPILADIDRIAFGTAIKVTQATPVTPSKRKDSDTVTEMTFTFKDITLAGNDYLAPVFLSYAEAKMSTGAMEKFLANAITSQIGEAMAKDVFARILTDASANSVTKSGSYFEAIGTALGKAKAADNPVIYAPSDLYYAVLKEVDSNGQPIVREGVVLGAEIKKDNAATKITVVDPKQFVLDDIAPVTLRVQEMVGKGGYDYAGYARAEGCLRKTNAAAFIA